MCGRYTNEAEFSEIKIAFNVEQIDLFREWTPKFNIAPSSGAGYEQPFIANVDGVRTAKLGRWWLIPYWWSKPLKELPTAFNARAEELATKPMWRDAFKTSRCLVPATGWREFVVDKDVPKAKKQPWHFKPGGVFAFAGLWSRWKSPEGERVESFTIVTTTPSKLIARFHDRMPLVLAPELHREWLSGDGAATLSRAQEAASRLTFDDIFLCDPVGNSVHVEDPSVIRRKYPREPPPRERYCAMCEELCGENYSIHPIGPVCGRCC